MSRWRFIINAFTRMRYLTTDGNLEFSNKSAPSQSQPDFVPWFKTANKKLKPHQKIVFGHWAALMGKTDTKQFIGLDTGYVWGNQLTLLNLAKNKQLNVSNIKK